jgi:hypothetical protein
MPPAAPASWSACAQAVRQEDDALGTNPASWTGLLRDREVVAASSHAAAAGSVSLDANRFAGSHLSTAASKPLAARLAQLLGCRRSSS